MSLRKHIQPGSVYWLRGGTTKFQVIAIRPMLISGWWACRAPFPCDDDDHLMVHEDSLSEDDSNFPLRDTTRLPAMAGAGD